MEARAFGSGKLAIGAALSSLLVAACVDGPVAPESSDEPRIDEAVVSSPWELQPLEGATDVEPIANLGFAVVGMSGGRPVLWEGGFPIPTILPSIGETPDRPHHFDGSLAVGETWTGSRHEIVVWRNVLGTTFAERIAVELVTGPGAPPMHVANGAANDLFVATVVQPGIGRRGVRFSDGSPHAAELYLQPLPRHDETEAYAVSHIGEVVGISRSAGSGNGTITVWPVTVDGSMITGDPMATPFSEDEYVPFGISRGNLYVNSLNGNAVVDHDFVTGASTTLENPGTGTYRGVATNGAGVVLGWITEGGDRTYGTWANGAFESLTPGWACHSIGATHVVCETPDRPWPFVSELDVLEPGERARVAHLHVVSRTSTSVTLGWTDIDDGTGSPARYRLKYAEPFFRWGSASVVCNVVGEDIGSELSCTAKGLDSGTLYDFQLYSYRLEGGSWVNTARSNIASAKTTGTAPPQSVDDLSILHLQTTAHRMTIRWTQVDDGTGNPAWYRVKYAESPMLAWKTASIACDRTIEGDEIGGELFCDIEGLAPATTYDVQLMSFEVVDGVWRNARFSNMATGTTATLAASTISP